MEKWKYQILISYAICSFIIAYPFFAIKYFETSIAVKLVVKYLLLTIFISLFIIVPKFYYAKVKPLDNNIPKTKFKEKRRDIISTIMILICSTGLFFGISFSLIITTNKFFGKSDNTKIKENVEKYYPYISKKRTITTLY